MIQFRPYQQKLYDEIQANLNVKQLLVQAPCGAGKSVLIGQLANDLSKEGRVLILTHRVELLLQNYEFLHKGGVLASKVNTVRYDSKIVIAMVETCAARIKKFGIKYLGDFDTIIVDECHVDIFKKVYSQYNYKRLVGFTATPMTNKREVKIVDGVEYSRPLSMANEYDKLISCVTEQELIDLGYLNQDYNIVLKLPNIDKLRTSDSDPDGYTRNSINEVYNNTASYETLYKAYTEYGIGKKTIIFNANSTINKNIYDYFIKKGIKCRMYDSVNKTEYSRDEVVEWFDNTPGALLINANVFTTGFNVPDTETVIVNRATKSLTLWLQAIGRGARITDKIYKDKFTVVDLGENIFEHGTFSKVRDWQEYFVPAEWKRKLSMDMISVWTCTYCGALTIIGEEKCCVCGEQKQNVVVENNKKSKVGTFEAVNEMPLPKASSIIKYCIANNLDGNFAFRLLQQRILELFISYKVSKQFYVKRRNDFIVRVKQVVVPIYFAILKSKEINSKRIKLDTYINQTIKKIDKFYGIE